MFLKVCPVFVASSHRKVAPPRWISFLSDACSHVEKSQETLSYVTHSPSLQNSALHDSALCLSGDRNCMCICEDSKRMCIVLFCNGTSKNLSPSLSTDCWSALCIRWAWYAIYSIEMNSVDTIVFSPLSRSVTLSMDCDGGSCVGGQNARSCWRGRGVAGFETSIEQLNFCVSCFSHFTIVYHLDASSCIHRVYY